MTKFSEAMKVLHQLSNRVRPKGLAKVSGKDRTMAWLRLLGITDERLQKIKFIHIAGTKGKGTTCLYTYAILSEYAKSKSPPLKTACLTSPHVSDVTERIRIESAQISKDLFSRYTLQLWKEIQHHSRRQQQKGEAVVIPGYPGFLTLLAFYIFVEEGVDVAVIETGLGGENDSTNVISRPSATGITSLGLDHVNILGNNIRSIAWHKGGIFKPQALAFTVEQEEPAMDILRQRSSERSVASSLKIVTEDVVRDFGVKVYPDMLYQRRNASLAIRLAEATITELEPGFLMTSEHARSIERAVLPGRNEVISGEKNVWLLSVAHNEISIKEASTWFRQTVTLPE